MACTGFQHSLRILVREGAQYGRVSSFLIPSISSSSSRHFSSSTQQCSRVGKESISIPPEVSLRFFDLPRAATRSRKADVPTSAVEISGPLGSMTLPLPPYLYTKYDEDARKVSISVGDANIRHQRAMWGTMRAHMQNYISGVSEGHICILRLVGVGYRASVDNSATTKTAEYPGQQFVNLKLGYAHPIEMGVPQGVKATTPQPTRILLEGSDKQAVTEFAAKIREWRKPEPYKGKGIFVNDETIRLKAKKIK